MMQKLEAGESSHLSPTIQPWVISPLSWWHSHTSGQNTIFSFLDPRRPCSCPHHECYALKKNTATENYHFFFILCRWNTRRFPASSALLVIYGFGERTGLRAPRQLQANVTLTYVHRGNPGTRRTVTDLWEIRSSAECPPLYSQLSGVERKPNDRGAGCKYFHNGCPCTPMQRPSPVLEWWHWDNTSSTEHHGAQNNFDTGQPTGQHISFKNRLLLFFLLLLLIMGEQMRHIFNFFW